MGIDRESAIRHLASRHSDLVSFILLICRDFHVAEDIYQDVLVELVGHDGAFENADHLMRWARKIARNRVIDAARRDTRRRLVFDHAVLDLIESDWDRARPMSDADMGDALHHCLQQLPDAARRLVELRYRDDLDGSQIAERVNRPRASIYVTLSRVHRTLAECIRRRLLPAAAPSNPEATGD